MEFRGRTYDIEAPAHPFFAAVVELLGLDDSRVEGIMRRRGFTVRDVHGGVIWPPAEE